nr:hypothetical protein [Tanacetum cinerariifolium]
MMVDNRVADKNDNMEDNRVANVQLKIPMRFNDHVMSNLSQKKDVSDKNDSMEDNRVADVDDRDQMEGTNMEKEGGVFRNTVYDEITQNSPTGSNNVNINDKRTEEANVGNENNCGNKSNKENDKIKSADVALKTLFMRIEGG